MFEADDTTADRSRSLEPRRNVEAPGSPSDQAPPAAHAGDPGEGAGSFDLRGLPRLLLRYRWLVLGAFVAGLGVAMLLHSTARPSYTTGALIYVGNPMARETGVTAIQTGPTQSPADWQNLMRSFVVLEPVARDLRLYVGALDPANAELLSRTEIVGEIVPGRYLLTVSQDGQGVRITDASGQVVEEGSRGAAIGRSLGVSLGIPVSALQPGTEIGFHLSRLRDAARGLSSGLTVQATASAYMAVSTTGPDPRFAADVVNAVTESFLVAATELSRGASDELSQTLQQQLDAAREALEEAERALESFQAANILRAPAAAGGAGSSAMNEYIDLQIQLDELERDRAAVQRALRGGDGDGGVRLQALEVIPAVIASSEFTRLLADVTEARTERRNLLQRYLPEHPLVVEVDRRLSALEREAIPALAAQILDDLSAREQATRARLQGRAAELSGIPTRSITEAGLQRDLDRAALIYEDVSARYASARLASVSTRPDVRVVDWAEPPARPDPDRRSMLALMALLGFTGGGVVGAVLLDRGDRRVRSPGAVEWQLGLQVLGVLPHLDHSKRKGRAEAREKAVEAFRAIRTAILYAHGSAGPLVLTVTSPGVGDGKSFTASNLALSFAELGRRTVVVDGDVRRGIQHKLLSVDRKPGLTDRLEDAVRTDDVIKPTDHPLLQVIPLGSLIRSAPELLSTSAMQDLLADLKERFDVILVDSCPLGAAADPVILGTLTGNMVMVLRSGSTDAEHAGAMLRNLRRFPVRVLGAIVNDVSASDDTAYYGYIAGYAVDGSEERPAPRSAPRLTGSRAS